MAVAHGTHCTSHHITLQAWVCKCEENGFPTVRWPLRSTRCAHSYSKDAILDLIQKRVAVNGKQSAKCPVEGNMSVRCYWSLAPLLPCSLAPLLPCSLAPLLSLSLCAYAVPMLWCSLAPLLSLSLCAYAVPMLWCSLAPLLPCSLALFVPMSLCCSNALVLLVCFGRLAGCGK
jgi:hypothetical protein